jgi:meiotically up-regulated gene 157 (Mug157) protein
VRFAVRLLAVAGLWLATLAPAGAQNLIALPLTGSRIHTADPRTLFHTLFSDFSTMRDGTTYVQTGDIPAMWLRDSSAQTIPYIRFQLYCSSLRAKFAGVIERNARNIVTDPYANAFTPTYGVWERKWEIDSLSWPVVLAFVYWDETHDRTVFTPALHRALSAVVSTYACEQRHATCSRYRYPSRVVTHNSYNPNTGMIWGGFRPSDDAVAYRFNIPQNAFAVVALHALAALASDGYRDERLSARALALAGQVYVGVERYGRFYNAERHVWMYPYETDGNGNNALLDDANIPNLTTLPYIGWSSSFDPTYLGTRAFTLSTANPYFFKGTYAEGLGSPHTPDRFIWPLGIIGRALTSTSAAEVSESITVLAETDSEDGLIHESFYADGYWRFTRADFGWANALYADLLFRSVEGMRAVPFTPGGRAIQPFQRASGTPTLGNAISQIQNQGAILRALTDLLAEYDRAPPAPSVGAVMPIRGKRGGRTSSTNTAPYHGYRLLPSPLNRG